MMLVHPVSPKTRSNREGTPSPDIPTLPPTLMGASAMRLRRMVARRKFSGPLRYVVHAELVGGPSL